MDNIACWHEKMYYRILQCPIVMSRRPKNVRWWKSWAVSFSSSIVVLSSWNSVWWPTFIIFRYLCLFIYRSHFLGACPLKLYEEKEEDIHIMYLIIMYLCLYISPSWLVIIFNIFTHASYVERRGRIAWENSSFHRHHTAEEEEEEHVYRSIRPVPTELYLP